MDHTGALDTEDELGPLAHLAPSPQSEAVAHEFQELSLQSSQHLPPLNERKNGEFCSMCRQLWFKDLLLCEPNLFFSGSNFFCQLHSAVCHRGDNLIGVPAGFE